MLKSCIFGMKRLQVLEEMYLVRLKLELLSQQSESKQGNMQELRGVDQGYKRMVVAGAGATFPAAANPLLL